jgi:hypothetical protein
VNIRDFEDEEELIEVEEYIKTVEDDVLENKYSSSFEGNADDHNQGKSDVEEEIIVSEEQVIEREGYQTRQEFSKRAGLSSQAPSSGHHSNRPMSSAVMRKSGGLGKLAAAA